MGRERAYGGGCRAGRKSVLDLICCLLLEYKGLLAR